MLNIDPLFCVGIGVWDQLNLFIEVLYKAIFSSKIIHIRQQKYLTENITVCKMMSTVYGPNSLIGTSEMSINIDDYVAEVI